MVASFAMLSACETASGARPDLSAQAPDPVVETKTITRTVCPDEIYRELPPEPVLGLDGQLTWNPEGGAWLDAKIERGEAAEDALQSAKTACAGLESVRP